MDDMTKKLTDKQGDEFDAEFLSMMIEHHQSGIDMAKLADERAEHAELKQMCSDIIEQQNQEIENMKAMKQQWGYE